MSSSRLHYLTYDSRHSHEHNVIPARSSIGFSQDASLNSRSWDWNGLLKNPKREKRLGEALDVRESVIAIF
jgi:hypothetical protein